MDGISVQGWVPSLVAVLGAVIAARQAWLARQAKAAAERSASAAEAQAKEAHRAADAAEESAQAMVQANKLESDRQKREIFDRAVDGLVEHLNQSGWGLAAVQAILDDLPPGVDPVEVIQKAHPRWRRARERSVETLLRSHGLLPPDDT